MTPGIPDIEDQLSRAEARLTELDGERNRLMRHISKLRDQLLSVEQTEARRLTTERASSVRAPAATSSAEKIALFMDLFRGRVDVYPRRWTNEKRSPNT